MLQEVDRIVNCLHQNFCIITINFFILGTPDSKINVDLELIKNDRNNHVRQAILTLKNDESLITGRFNQERDIINQSFLV